MPDLSFGQARRKLKGIASDAVVGPPRETTPGPTGRVSSWDGAGGRGWRRLERGVDMGNLLHVCLYNIDADRGPELETSIRSLNFVRMDVQVSTPEALATILQDSEINLVLFHLDPDLNSVVEVIEQVSSRYPELALIAVSHRTEPEAILAPMRAGCDQFVCEPIDQKDLAAAISRAAGKHLLSKPRSKCICITGASGGAGATSIACNLALEIGHLTNRVCALVDLDLQFGDVALNFDCEPKFNFHDLAAAGADLDRSVLVSALHTLPCNVAVVARPDTIEQAAEVTEDTIQRVIQLMTGSYENIVFDMPCQQDSRTACALALADVIFIVCQRLVPSIRNAKRYYDFVNRMGISDERVKILLNREGTRNERITAKDVEETIGQPVYATIPNDYQFVARSIDLGRPIAALDQNNPVRVAIREIARELTREPGAEDSKPEERRGFLSRFLAK